MEIEITLTAGPILPPPPAPGTETGALLEFQGRVRDREEDRRISALRYEVYEAMAEKELRRILQKLGAAHPCQSVLVIHRYGEIPVGEAAIFVRVESAHRGAGLRLLEELMNELKREVPIWKVEAVPC